MLNRHVILETSHVKKKMFLTFALLLTAEASLGDACGAACRAAAAFRKEEHTIFALSFNIFFTLKLFHCAK